MEFRQGLDVSRCVILLVAKLRGWQAGNLIWLQFERAGERKSSDGWSSFGQCFVGVIIEQAKIANHEAKSEGIVVEIAQRDGYRREIS